MSLAEQLKKLQIPGQPVIDQISSKRVSLLFDERNAASLDNEAIQNIGFNGFNELLTIDPVFAQFSQLFDSSSLRFQRNLEQANVGKKIKKKIKDYLILLSPYLVLKPAQKTLEWLVRRFQCHIWDKDELIACILPYHETLLFGRIIQLFGSESTDDSWDWLLTSQKGRRGFSTQSLINHCIANRKLLTFICQMADAACEALQLKPKSGLKIVFSFYARMLVCVVESNSNVGEDLLSFLLPFIHSGLKSHVKDYVCSTYMIITAIASKTKLMKDVTKAILASVLKSINDTWYEEALLCFLSVIQLQNVKLLSPRVFKLFVDLNQRNYITLFENIQKDHDISVLIDILIPLLCKSAVSSEDNAHEKYISIIKDIINNLKLGEDQISTICRSLIGACLSYCSSVETHKLIPQNVQKLLAHLASKYASVFDESISLYFNNLSANGNKKQLQLLKEITMCCLPSEKHSVYGNSDLPLLLSLNHPDKNIRIVAIQQLFSTFMSEEVMDKSFFTDAVIARLNDDSSDVIHAILMYPKSIMKLLPRNALFQFVMKLMQSNEHYNMNELITSIIKDLSIYETSVEIDEFTYALLGQLMFAFTGKKNKKLIDGLASLEFESKNIILKGITKALFHIPTHTLIKKDCSDDNIIGAFSSLIRHVVDTIMESGNRMNILEDLWNYIQKMPTSHTLHFVGLLIIISIVEKAPQLVSKVMGLDFMKYLELASDKVPEIVAPTKTYEEKKKYLFTKYFACLNSDVPDNFNRLLDNTFFTFLQIVIKTLHNNQHTESVLAKQRVFNIVSSKATVSNSTASSGYQTLLNQFLMGSFYTKSDMVLFLNDSYMKILDMKNMDDECFKAAVCSLHILKSLLPLVDMKDLDIREGVIYAAHIALLSNPYPLIRKIVLNNIKLLTEKVGETDVWSSLFKSALECGKEIVLDNLSVRKCWQTLFTIKEQKDDEFGSFMKKSKKDISSDQKREMLHDLMKMFKHYPRPLQVTLLDTLELIDHKFIMEDSMNLVKDIACKDSIDTDERCMIKIVLKWFRPEMFESLTDLFPLFVNCLRHEDLEVQKCAFDVITPSFYDNLTMNYKGLLIRELLKILLLSQSVVISTDIRIVIKSLDLDTVTVASLLGQFCDTFDLMYTFPPSVTNEVQFDLDEEALKMPMWRSLGELLDAVSSKEKIKQPELLVPKVFHSLERCLKCKNVEFIKQLLLQILLSLTRQDLSKLSEDQFQVELLIQCLQTSGDTHTSHQCLMVLSNAARLYPTRVLHNVMHIFSFMGGTLLRLDNAYSFEIIEKTIDAVVPVLLKKEESRKRLAPSSINEIVTFIAQTFVDSIPHCPEHRREHIIKHLVKLLQPDEYLHTIMILLLKKVTLQHKQVSEEEDMRLSPVSLEFCQDLYSSYPVSIQVHSLYRMVAYINKMAVEKKPGTYKQPEKLSTDLLFDVNDKQANVFRYTLISFALEILRNENMEFQDVKPSSNKQLTQLYLNLIEELFSYSDKLGQSGVEPKQKHVKSLLHKVSEVIGQLYKLLPFDSFIDIISKLLLKDNELIRKKSLELLCKKLGSLTDVEDMQELSLIPLFNTLLALVKHKEENNEGTGNKQLILYAIKLITMKLFNSQKEPFVKAVPVIAQLYTVNDANEKLSISAMLCIAELSSYLKADMLPYIPIIMKPLFHRIAIKDSFEYKKGDTYLSSCVLVLHTLLKSLSQFLSPHVTDYLVNVASYESIANSTSDTLLMQKITILKEDMGKFFPPRVLFPAVEACFESMLLTNKDRTTSVIDVYRYSFKTISKADANSNYSKDIMNITKKIFDLRCVLGEDDENICLTLENMVIQGFSDLIFKLTENTLRPLILELLEWATETSKMSPRLLSFYRLSVEIAKSLKSLFLLFVVHIFKNASDVLANVNSSSEKFLNELVKSILDMLANCFYYDSQGFMNKERFESILLPLTSQMESGIHGEKYMEFVKKHLSPCIVNFAAAVNDPACWKQLNHQILLKTKSEDAEIRLASLHIMEKIYSRLGESYMILIPETIPFLAEILEDDSIEVEKQSQRVIQAIEDISGESIQKYF